MPLVKAYFGHIPGGYVDKRDADTAQQGADLLDSLSRVCWEIIPAAMTSAMGPLTPGSIQFIGDATSAMAMTTDVVLEVEAYDFSDRHNLDDRAEDIRMALRYLFPDLTFAIWVKLVRAGYASYALDPDFDGDMSMPAAIARAKRRLAPPSIRDIADGHRRARRATGQG
jgi:hypothetical protein